MGIFDLFRYRGRPTSFSLSAFESGGDEFARRENRLLRYAVFEALVDGTAFTDQHVWSIGAKTQLGLYRHIRPVFNPSYRLVEFYRSVIWGGALDLHRAEKGAIPIRFGYKGELENSIRAQICKIWRDSNWPIVKGIVTQYGATYGDVGIRIVDDPEKRRVTLEVVHPRDIVSVERDIYGHIKGYVIERIVSLGDKSVVYREEAIREKDEMGRNTSGVIFRTYKDGELYAWNGIAAEWREDYGFVPFVLIQHNNVGEAWGWSELHPGWRKFIELDDMASKLHDQIRKTVHPMLLANFASAEIRKTKRVQYKESDATAESPQPGREELPILFVDRPDARLMPILAELPIGEVVEEINNMIREFERDYPELQMDIWRIERDTSALALSRVRKRVERKVLERRENYDNALTRALQMALSIARMRGYYKDIDLEAYDNGQLDFWVDSERPVFDIDESEFVERKLRFWQAVATGSSVVPPDVVLEDMGWGAERLETLGRARLASIALEQEDVVPGVEQ